jgi:hypothetical protein
MIKEFSGKNEIKSSWNGTYGPGGPGGCGTYNGTVVPSDLDKRDKSENAR